MQCMIYMIGCIRGMGRMMSNKDNADAGGRKYDTSFEERFYGAVTVGERGQIVIPADARKKFNIGAGDKLLIMAHMDKGLMLFKIDALREFMSTVLEDLQRVEQEFDKENKTEEPTS